MSRQARTLLILGAVALLGVTGLMFLAQRYSSIVASRAEREELATTRATAAERNVGSPAAPDQELAVVEALRVADRFIESYREITGDPLSNLAHWETVGLCRPMPDIGIWVPAWNAMGRATSPDKARSRYNQVLEDFLERTA